MHFFIGEIRSPNMPHLKFCIKEAVLLLSLLPFINQSRLHFLTRLMITFHFIPACSKLMVPTPAACSTPLQDAGRGSSLCSSIIEGADRAKRWRTRTKDILDVRVEVIFHGVTPHSELVLPHGSKEERIIPLSNSRFFPPRANYLHHSGWSS